MSILKKLFGGGGAGGAAPEAEAETYQGFTIRPEPIRDGATWRIAARIEKDGQSHHLIRADTLESFDAAAEASARKARQVIDEQGMRLFG